MMEPILKIFAEVGGFYGLIMCCMGAAVVMLWRHINKQQEQLIELQNMRVREARELSKELMEFSDKSNRALGELIVAVNALKDAVLSGIRGR